MAEKLEEKRHFPRVRIKSPLRCQVRGSHEFNNAIGEDISAGGLSFINNRFIARATPVMLEVNLLSRILTPIGKIAWASPIPHSDRYRLGIEFIEIEPQDKKYLSDFIEMRTDKT